MHNRSRRRGFVLGRAQKTYRLAEFCRDKGDMGRALVLLKAALKLGLSGPEKFIALILNQSASAAFAELGKLLSGKPSGDDLFYLVNPWLNIYDSAFLKRQLRALSLLRPGGRLGAIRRLYILMLRSRIFTLNGLQGRTPRVPRLNLPRKLVMFSILQADVLLEQGNPAAALPYLRRIKTVFPDNEYVCGRLAEALLCSGGKKEAFRFMTAKGRQLRSPGFYAWHGQLLLFAGEYRAALCRLKRAKAAGCVFALCWSGAALFKAGNSRAALKDLNSALKANPGDLEARVWRGELLRIAGKEGAAQKEFDFVLEKNSAYLWALINKALLRDSAASAGALEKLRLLLPKSAMSGVCGLKKMLTRAKGVRRNEASFLKLSGL